MQMRNQKKTVYFVPAVIALADAAVDFFVPTHPKVNSNGVPYFGYLMLIVAAYYLIKAIVASGNLACGVKYRPSIKFVCTVRSESDTPCLIG